MTLSAPLRLENSSDRADRRSADGLGNGKKVKVVVRVRPTMPSESSDSCLTVAENKVQIMNPKNSNELIEYSFDSCYDTKGLQAEIFQNEAIPLVETVLRGENATIFAYGMTGAGKTFTMQGSNDQEGIIPRAVRQIMKSLNSRQYATADRSRYSVNMSVLEIYNEKVYDLLVPKEQDLPIREDTNRTIFVSNLAEVVLQDYADFERHYVNAMKNRSTAWTKLNAQSSRSHSILLIKVSCVEQSVVLVVVLTNDNHRLGCKMSTMQSFSDAANFISLILRDPRIIAGRRTAVSV